MSLWTPPEGLGRRGAGSLKRGMEKSGTWEETATERRLGSNVRRGGGVSEGPPRSLLVWKLTFRAYRV